MSLPAGRATLLFALFCLLALPLDARSDLAIRTSPTIVRMAAGSSTRVPVLISSDPATSILNVDLSLGISIVEGRPSSTISIEALDATAPDNIWEGGPILIPFPALPNDSPAVLTVFQLTSANADGNVFDVTFGSQNASVGDVFNVSLNEGGHSSVGGGAGDLTSQTDFMTSRILIVADPSIVADFNGDGQVNVADVDSFMTGLRQGITDPYYDLDGSGSVDVADRDYLIETIFNTFYGDANLDGVFDSSDLIQVFQAGEYEDGIDANSTWAEGDWDGDREVASSDMILAFQAAGYDQGPRVAAVVPEPSASLLLAASAVLAVRRRRRSN